MSSKCRFIRAYDRVHTLDTKLAIVDGAILGHCRIAFVYDCIPRMLYPHLRLMRDGRWYLFGVELEASFHPRILMEPRWICLSIDEITGVITALAGD